MFKQKKSKILENPIKYKSKLIYDDRDQEHILYVTSKYYKFVIYWYNDEPKTCYLSNIYVKKKYRGLGLGNYLLNQAIEIIKENEFKKIYLKVNSLTWMYKWYIRNGFNFYEYDSFSWKRQIEYCWLIKNL